MGEYDDLAGATVREYIECDTLYGNISTIQESSVNHFRNQ